MVFHRRLLLLFLLLIVNTSNAQESCGWSTCSADEECCNRSCGTCVEKGGFCTQQLCYSCFPGSSTVEVLGKGTMSLIDIQVGDRIQTAGGRYHLVYAFGHSNNEATAEYRTIVTDNGHSFQVSGKHLVFHHDIKHPVPAEDIQVGDALQTNDGPSRVTRILQNEQTGVYAPFTTDGTLLIDGVATSCYVSLPGLESYPWLQAFLSHLALAPFRSFCTMTKSKACQQYNEEGISEYSAFLLQLWQQKSAWGLVLFLYLVVAGTVAGIEFAVSSVYGSITLVCFLCVWMRYKKAR